MIGGTAVGGSKDGSRQPICPIRHRGGFYQQSRLTVVRGLIYTAIFALCSQGEDVVSGLVNTLPISETQRKRDYRDSSLSLESGFPKIYAALVNYAIRLIEEYGFVHQEIEFTFESENAEDLYISPDEKPESEKTDFLFDFSANSQRDGIGWTWHRP